MKSATADKPTKPKIDKEAISQSVLQGMQSGMSCFKACQKAGISHSAFLGWVADDSLLRDNYARAREDLIERIANEVMELSDQDVPETGDGKRDWQAIQKHKLQVDSRKWLLSKLAPRKYGEKLEVSGDPENPLVHRIERVVVKV